MRVRFFTAFAVLLLGVGAVAPVAAFEFKPSRLEALAARHDLRDQVCIAMADGRLSAWERAEILTDAKRILHPEEYVAFKRALDRLAPPPPKKTASKSRTRIARKPAAGRPAAMPEVRENSPLKLPAEPPVQSVQKPARGPVIPAGAILPDRMALRASPL